jgi:diacylglycerol kinase family enzyme
MDNGSAYFIVNPAADTGRLKKKWPKYHKQIEEIVGTDIEFAFSDYPTHAMELTQKADESGYHTLFTVGGDGIANEAANSILKNDLDITLGMLPAGTSNDFHITHNFPPNPVDTFVAMQEGKEFKSEVGKVTGDFGDPYYFIIHADCGVAADAARAARDGTKLLKGELKYTYYAIKTILKGKRNYGVLKVDDKVFEEDFTLIGVAMTNSMAGYKLWPGNTPQRGDFAVAFSYGQNRRQMLKLLLAAEKGNHLKYPGVEYMRGKRVEISLNDPWCYQAEGEIFTDGSRELVMELVPDALKILLPHDDF